MCQRAMEDAIDKGESSLLEGILAELTTDARLLVATKRHLRMELVRAVDLHPTVSHCKQDV